MGRLILWHRSDHLVAIHRYEDGFHHAQQADGICAAALPTCSYFINTLFGLSPILLLGLIKLLFFQGRDVSATPSRTVAPLPG